MTDSIEQAAPDVRGGAILRLRGHQYTPAQNSKGATVMVCVKCGDYRTKGTGHE